MMHITPQMVQVLVNLCVGRRDDYAYQRSDGSYYRARHALSYSVIAAHLAGEHTIGSYVIDEDGTCRFAVFDCDKAGGLVDLLTVQSHLADDGIPSYLEASRRGGHLWVFLSSLLSPAQLRQWLLPYCPAGMEFYPKQDQVSSGPGSLVRVPLGVHQLSGDRYPFVQLVNRRFVPVAHSIGDTLTWLSTIEPATVPPALPSVSVHPGRAITPQKKYPSKTVRSVHQQTHVTTIRDWCLQQDPFEMIGRYVDLDHRGMAHCPFVDHHAHGEDRHSSFWVYRPVAPDVCCWYCHTWEQGGSVFDFLRLYYSLDARDLWGRICAGAQF